MMIWVIQCSHITDCDFVGLNGTALLSVAYMHAFFRTNSVWVINGDGSAPEGFAVHVGVAPVGAAR